MVTLQILDLPFLVRIQVANFGSAKLAKVTDGGPQVARSAGRMKPTEVTKRDSPMAGLFLFEGSPKAYPRERILLDHYWVHSEKIS